MSRAEPMSSPEKECGKRNRRKAFTLRIAKVTRRRPFATSTLFGVDCFLNHGVGKERELSHGERPSSMSHISNEPLTPAVDNHLDAKHAHLQVALLYPSRHLNPVTGGLLLLTRFALRYFSSRYGPRASASIPVLDQHFTASMGVQTIGSPLMLKDVLSTQGTPLSRSISFKSL